MSCGASRGRDGLQRSKGVTTSRWRWRVKIVRYTFVEQLFRNSELHLTRKYVLVLLDVFFRRRKKSQPTGKKSSKRRGEGRDCFRKPLDAFHVSRALSHPICLSYPMRWDDILWRGMIWGGMGDTSAADRHGSEHVDATLEGSGRVALADLSGD